MQARAVIRDVGRALDIPLREVDMIAKLIPEVLNISLDTALSQEPRLRQLAEEDPRFHDLITVARALEGLPRHASTHAAGAVIGDRPLVEHLPLAKGKKGEVVTQYDMKCVEKIGLVKFDLLGLRNLTVMKHACEIIRKGGGVPPDLGQLDLTDKGTFKLLAGAQTTGVFQLESSGMKDLLRRLRPSCFEDIVALVALYRPGPLDSGMHDAFVERKNGQVPVSYTLPELEPILKDTYGVILYQEQVMNIASVLADYTMAEADNLRKAMGKKIAHLMAQERKRFLTRATRKGVDPKKAEEIFDLMEKFGRYGFNKAHSAAYALIAYQTAYLKTYFPVEFLAALLTSEMNSTEAVVKYIAECRSQRIEVLPPDINQSDVSFTVSDDAIRFGLAAVKNVGEAAIESIIAVRNESGPFTTLYDFCERVDQRRVNRRVVESLIKCGAFDSTGAKRSQMMAVLDDGMDIGQKIHRDRINGQISLFDVMAGQGAGDNVAYPPLPEIGEWDEKEFLNSEKEALGFFITGHPLAAYEKILEKVASTDTSGLKELPDGCTVRIGGLVRDIKRYHDRKGDLMAFLTLEDLKGFVEVTLFSSVYAEVMDIVQEDAAIFVEGRMTKDENSVKILGTRVVSIDKAEETWTTSVRLNLDAADLDQKKLKRICSVLRQHEGNCSAYIHLKLPKQAEAIIELPVHLRVKAGKALSDAVYEVMGDGVVETVCESQ
jgi:DNA polymerase-3 subunit alpha